MIASWSLVDVGGYIGFYRLAGWAFFAQQSLFSVDMFIMRMLMRM